jgi:hypothetical protein
MDVDEDVRNDHEARGQQHRSLDHRVVGVHDRLVVEAADAGDPEDRLRQHRAAEQQADVESGERHERRHRRAQPVVPHDAPLAQSLGARRAHVVL